MPGLRINRIRWGRRKAVVGETRNEEDGYPNSLVSRYCAAARQITYGIMVEFRIHWKIYLATYTVRSTERLSHALLTDKRGDYHNSC